jgi:hypothetical protein
LGAGAIQGCALFNIHMRDRHQPGRVVKRSAAEVDDMLAPGAVSVDSPAAIAAKP